MKLNALALISVLPTSFGFTTSSHALPKRMSQVRVMASASSSTLASWTDLKTRAGETIIGKALNDDAQQRAAGHGSPNVHNTLRLFDAEAGTKPQITFYRDHAGWCPYCEKTMFLIEEKKVPIQVSLVPMRSYGDKPAAFLQKVPSGLLPAIEVQGQIITESSVIMELLDKWHTVEDGYLPMIPDESDSKGRRKYEELARLERELFSWWCTLLFRPEMPQMGGNMLKNLMGGGSSSTEMSGSMKGFMDCMRKVDNALKETSSPWFLEYDYPTAIDFLFVSHVERMLASCAYWKGLDLRDKKWNFHAINKWFDSFEKREYYLGFKADYYNTVKNIPPQYGPGSNGGFENDRIAFSNSILGKDKSWHLPLPHDDPLQPLYRGPPLPLCVLEAAGIQADPDGSYEVSANENAEAMKLACRSMAAWKISGNGVNIAKFAARGGPEGSRNPRKTFGAELADPYAGSDASVQASVDSALRVICEAMLDTDDKDMPSENYIKSLKEAVGGSSDVSAVVSSLAYLRDRVGVPRDLPLASARYLRAYLNWGIDTLSK